MMSFGETSDDYEIIYTANENEVGVSFNEKSGMRVNNKNFLFLWEHFR